MSSRRALPVSANANASNAIFELEFGKILALLVVPNIGLTYEDSS